MALFPIQLHQAAGEYMEAVLVTEWSKAPGDAVKEGELLVTVETAKASTEIAAERNGWLAAIDVPEGQEAELGVPLGYLTDTEGERAERTEEKREDAEASPVRMNPVTPQARDRVSPYARRLAREQGVALAGVTGTGPKGRIKARDLPTPVPGDRSTDPPLVLLHGFGADRTAWHGLRALLPGRVIALDLPCHGDRLDLPVGSLSDLSDDVASQLDALGIEEIHLAGHSLGGAVALALASSGRVIIRSLVLIAPAGLSGTVSRSFTKAFLTARNDEEMQAALEWVVADPSKLPAGLASITLNRLDSGSARARLAALEQDLFSGETPFDQGVVLNQLSIPIRLIRGTADRVIAWPPSAGLPGAVALHLLDGVGHMPQLEQPALVARLLLETLRSATG